MKKPTELEVAREEVQQYEGKGGGALLAKCVLGPSVCLCAPPHTALAMCRHSYSNRPLKMHRMQTHGSRQWARQCQT